MIFLLIIPIIVIAISVAVMIPRWRDPSEFNYNYYAVTNAAALDHQYKFFVKKVGNGYRCYIRRTPSYRGRDTSNYLPHYWVENKTDKHYICWTGEIKYPEQAKTLCRNWADATQKFIDTGVPAPGFKR
ncbi:MAG: hypothetical protein J1E81_02450 [Eubacterium sp.]|nr:hypothetical protein [Eubacterium sp.]